MQLSAGVVNSDVQLLIDPTNGESIMIDLTEASIIPTTTSSDALSANEVNSIQNFISEVFAYLPSDQYSNLAVEAASQIERKLIGVTHSGDQDQRFSGEEVQHGINRAVLEEAKKIIRQYL